jgi:predicted RNase H-like HicB family nuclease
MRADIIVGEEYIFVKGPVMIEQEGDWFIARFIPLDIVTQGRSEEEAKSRIKEAVEGYLIGFIKKGTLDKVLEKYGFKEFKPDLHHYSSPKKMHKGINIEFPINLSETPKYARA